MECGSEINRLLFGIMVEWNAVTGFIVQTYKIPSEEKILELWKSQNHIPIVNFAVLTNGIIREPSLLEFGLIEKETVLPVLF